MQSAGGDIVTVLDADIQPFKIGLQGAAREASNFGGNVSGSLGRAVGQVGFAMQDFSSVLSMGGKNAMGRALMGTMNNVQMLGQAFGPMGMAITSVGGALGSMFIPKLFETTEATSALKTELEAVAKAADEAHQRFGEAMRLSAKAEDIKTRDQGLGMKKGLQLDEKILEDEKRRLLKQQKDIKERLAQPEVMKKNRWGFGSSQTEADAADRAAAVEQLNAINKKIEENTSKLGANRVGQGAVDRATQEAFESELFDASMKKALKRDSEKMRAEMATIREEEQKADQEHHKHVQEQIQYSHDLLRMEKEREEAAARVAKEIATPYEEAANKQRELQSLLQDEVITRSQYDRATTKNAEDLAKGLEKSQGKNEAVERGTSRAYDAIRESQKAMKSQDEATKFLERIARNTDKIDRITDMPDRKREVVEIMA